MTYLRMGFLAVSLTFLTSFTQTQNLCQGFVPENDLNIPVDSRTGGGITEQDFNQVLDILSAYYAPIIAAKGGTLSINRRWTDGTVNASAQRTGSTYVLNMYGGLARHAQVNKDLFMLVACHEAGHHLGGAPKYGSFFGGNDWASNEGQADYFATMRCLRFVFTDSDNAQFVATQAIDPILSTKCEEVYTNQADENACKRIGMAGVQGGYFFQALRSETVVPKLDTPDSHVVTKTSDSHPATQCRMDTYYQGTICDNNKSIELSDTDATVGTCNTSTGQSVGTRPLCWFKP